MRKPWILQSSLESKTARNKNTNPVSDVFVKRKKTLVGWELMKVIQKGTKSICLSLGVNINRTVWNQNSQKRTPRKYIMTFLSVRFQDKSLYYFGCVRVTEFFFKQIKSELFHMLINMLRCHSTLLLRWPRKILRCPNHLLIWRLPSQYFCFP